MSIKIGSTEIKRLEILPPVEYVKVGSNTVFTNQMDVIMQMYNSSQDSTLSKLAGNTVCDKTENKMIKVTYYAANTGPYSSILGNSRPYCVTSLTCGNQLEIVGPTAFSGVSSTVFTGSYFTPTTNSTYNDKLTSPNVPLSYYNSLTSYTYSYPSIDLLRGTGVILEYDLSAGKHYLELNFTGFDTTNYSNLEVNVYRNGSLLTTIERTSLAPTTSSRSFNFPFGYAQTTSSDIVDVYIYVSPTNSPNTDVMFFAGDIGCTVVA